MIKLTRLKEMIAEKGQTYKKCAAVIHVSPQTFTKKMHGSSMFGIEEANNLGDFLGMTGKEKIDIFINSLNLDQMLPESLDKYILFPDNMGPICNRKTYNLNTINDVLNYPLLHTNSNTNAWNIWLDRSRLHSAHKSSERYFDSLNLMIEAAVSGLGIAIAPQILVEKEILSGRIVAPFGFIYCDYNFYAVVRKNSANSEVMNIVNWLQSDAKTTS